MVRRITSYIKASSQYISAKVTPQVTRKSNLYMVSISLMIVVCLIAASKSALANGGNCTSPSCTSKQIGEFNSSDDTLITTAALSLGSEYWVSVRVDGRSSSGLPSGVKNDVFIALDISTSMIDPIPISNTNSTTVTREDAAKIAAKRFVELSDPATDNLGFLFFPGCRVYNSASGIPIWWSYDRFNPYTTQANKYFAMAAITQPLQTVNNKQSWYDMIDRINYHIVNIPTPVQVSTACLNHGGGNTTAGTWGGNYYAGGATSIGAGVSAANSVMTNSLASLQAFRPDGTSYRNSMYSSTINNGPVSASTSRKHIIVISDGREGAYPLVHDEEIDRSGTIIQKAIDNGIKIHNVMIGANSSAEINYVRDISNRSNGQFFHVLTRDEVVSALNSVSSTIDGTASGSDSRVKITERINEEYFEIIPLTLGSTFRIQRIASDGTRSFVHNSMCSGLDCVDNEQFRNGTQLSGFDVELGTVPANESRIIYFKVRAIQSSAGAIPVNDTTDTDGDESSTANYSDLGITEILGNTNVSIGSSISQFFQIAGGNVFSNGSSGVYSINSQLPESTTTFDILDNSIVYSIRPNSFGIGEQSISKYHSIGYSIPSFNFSELSSSIQQSSASMPSYSSLPEGVSVLRITDDVILDNINPTISRGKQVIIFAERNVYLKNNIEIPKDGNSSLVIYAAGNIGIDRNTTTAHGLFLAEGVIDTACDSNLAFNGLNECSSNGTPNRNLRIEGGLIAKNGLKLERIADPPNAAAELIVFRPDFYLSAALSAGRTSVLWTEVTN